MAREFSDGLAAVNIGWKRNNNGKWGYIDASGKIVIDSKFDIAEDFERGGCFCSEQRC